MTVIDLTIIYLACGAPLSMHYFFAARRKPTIYFLFGGIVVTLFWPIAAISFLVNASSLRAKGIADPLTEAIADLDAHRIKIENLAFKDEIPTSVFEFREVFSRYSGLVQASQITLAASETNEIFRLSRHANGQLATRCLSRNAAARLLSHADHARRDFIDLAGNISNSQTPNVLSLLTEIAAILGDDQTVERLQLLTERTRRSHTEDLKKVEPYGTEHVHATLT